jgi:hypothetical protein
MLGPVQVQHWQAADWHGQEVVAERWSISPADSRAALDVIELSVRVDPQGAEITQARMENLSRQNGLDPDSGQPTKTRRFLEQLLTAATQ